MGKVFGLISGKGVTGAVAALAAVAALVGIVAVTFDNPPSGASAAASRPAVVEVTSAVAPVITKGPSDPTNDKSVGFDYSYSRPAGAFECNLDDGISSCNKNHVQYPNVGLGRHCFKVRAVELAGKSPWSESWCWTSVTDGFPISGSTQGLFFPGSSERLDLRIGNPYNFPLKVESVAITVDAMTTKAGCTGSNLKVAEPFDGASAPVWIPKNSTKTLSELRVAQSQWPLIEMPNLSTNQDACKNATFTFRYSGAGTK